MPKVTIELTIVEREQCERCKKNAASEPHSCPYLRDIEDDQTTMCTCCEECSGACADDV